MSIFQIKEWWATTVGNGEEFDKQSICIGNVDNANPPENKLVVGKNYKLTLIGSFAGILRIYYPQQKKFNSDDLLLEKDLGGPILQVSCGKFAQEIPMTLAVLFSRRLLVYAVVPQESHLDLQVLYGHSYDRNAFNFISGKFGKKKNEIMCVQSVDGALFFSEYDTLLFQIQLPDFLIPGPLIYASNIDSLVITNSNLELECYKFQSLKAFTNNNINAQKAAQQNNGGAKTSKLEPDWIANMGEQIYHLQYHQNTVLSKWDLVAVGEQTFFILTEGGIIRFQKRLDFAASCIKVYHLPSPTLDVYECDERTTSQVLASSDVASPCFSYILGSFSHYLLVYKDIQLVWTAKTQTAPIYVNTCRFGSQEGLIVTLSDQGYLQVTYLGTEQPVSSIGGEQENLDQEAYNRMHYEHQKLLQRIRNQEDEKQVEPEDSLGTSCTISSMIDYTNECIEDPKNELTKTAQGIPRMKMKITLSYQGPFSSTHFKNVQVQLHLPDGVFSENSTFHYPSLLFKERASTPKVIQVYLHPTTKCVPSSSRVTVSTTYLQVRESQQSGQLRNSSADIKLPIAFFVGIGPPGEGKNNDTDAKLNFVLDKPMPSIVSMYEDVVEGLQARQLCTNKKAMSFILHNSVPVHILISKDDIKVRIQSPDFSCMWFITSDLIRRINEIFSILQFQSYIADGVKIQLPDQVPLKELFVRIDSHFAVRNEIERLRKELEDRTLQFRVIQKRILNRFKDKNPSPLNNLDFLLNTTYAQIVDTASDIEGLRIRLKEEAEKLTSAVELVVLLMKVKFERSQEEYEALRNCFSPHIDDENEQSWEDIVNTSMTHLLKTCLAKGGGGAAQNINSQIKHLSEVNKLKHNITQVCERIFKGGKVEL